MARGALALLAASALLVAGCGGDEGEAEGGSSASAAKAAKEEAAMKKEKAAAEGDAMKGEKKAGDATAAKKGETVKVVDSQFGPILADGNGQALYLFDKEKTRTSECYGACAEAWPPVLTEGPPGAGSGAEARLLGTTKRRDGKLQATYRGRPVYLYKDDAPGKVLCHNVDEFGGLWLVVKPDGTPVS